MAARGSVADYTDQIGAHLDDPIRFPDDAARATALCAIPLQGYGLDIGCSDGGLIARWMAASPKATCHAIDTRPITDAAEATARRFGVQSRVTFGEWPDEYAARPMYAWVTCCEVLEHLTPPDGDVLLGAVMRLLPPGTPAIITVPNRAYTNPDRERWSWPDHRQFFTADTLHTYLSRWFRHVTVEPLVDDVWLLARCRV